LIPAERLAHLRPSPIRALSEGAPADSVPMGLGEPGWDLPAPAREALARVSGPCAYGPNAGLPELQAAVGAFHSVGPASWPTPPWPASPGPNRSPTLSAKASALTRTCSGKP
jgi:hypothetical protein